MRAHGAICDRRFRVSAFMSSIAARITELLLV
jgi:hypothetical protein